MATDQELADYWSTVKADASTGFIEEESQGVLDNLQDQVGTSRDEAMTFSDQYKYTPGEVTDLSTRLDNVLDKDSAYIQRARTKANEEAGGRGLLNSSMASGAAEGAAIDRGLKVAEGDVGVDKFNVGAQTEADKARYSAAQNFANVGQQSENQLTGDQFQHVLGEEGKQRAREWETDFLDQKQQDALGLAREKNTLEKGILTEKQTDALELSKQNFSQEYQIKLADLRQRWSELDAELTSKIDIERVSNTTSVQNRLLEGWEAIQTAEMTGPEKTAALNEYKKATEQYLTAASSFSFSMPGAPNYPDELADDAPDYLKSYSQPNDLTSVYNYYTADGLSDTEALSKNTRYMDSNGVKGEVYDKLKGYPAGTTQAYMYYTEGLSIPYGAPKAFTKTGDIQEQDILDVGQYWLDDGKTGEEAVSQVMFYGALKGIPSSQVFAAYGIDTPEQIQAYKDANPGVFTY